MKLSTSLVLALPALAAAYPGLMGAHSREEIEHMLNAKRDAEAARAAQEKRGLLSDLGLDDVVGNFLGTVQGLLGSVASAIDPDNLRPEPGYEFQEPGPNDSRGPCPGLNLLANYGYLPRDGYVNYGQVVEATARGFNMGADLSSVLIVFAILADGDIATESWYLGTSPDNVGGLNRHSTVEADISPNREDFYLGCGDNHHLSSRLFKQNVAFASESSSKQFDLEVMGNQYAAQAAFSQTNNPYIYFFPFPMIVSLGAFAFYPNFFSNGTYRAGGVANYESISSIIGAEFDEGANEFRYVPERWPENWYRRATPYGAVEALTDAVTYIYSKNIVLPGVSQSLENLSPETILCDVYQGINSILPLAVAQTGQDAGAALSWALSKLDPFFLNTALGCPAATLSSNPQGFELFPDKKGGPLQEPPAQDSNAGNNVYNKIYFTDEPTTPQCNHVSG